MAHYFKVKRINAIPQKPHAAGPDFLKAGEAIEVKGTNSSFDGAIQQFLEYLFTGKYKGLSVAFPHDFLDTRKLIGFRVFCDAASYVIGRMARVSIYLLTEDENSYYVRNFFGCKEIVDEVFMFLDIQFSFYAREMDRARFSENTKELLKRFDKTILWALDNMIRRRAHLRLPKIHFKDRV